MFERLFKSYTLDWKQTGAFKTSMVSIGILIGARWANFFRDWETVLAIIFVVSSVYIVSVWWKQVR